MGVDTQFPAGEFEAAGVVYEPSPHAPGLRLFQCQPYKATISAKSCAVRFRKAQDAVGSMAADLEHCKCCPIGSCHAGQGQVRFSPWYGKKICPRCGTGTTRIIGGRLCVGCYNRQREMKIGRNGRGNVPVELLKNPLRALDIIVDVDGTATRRKDRDTQSMTETMAQILRTTKGGIAFGFAGPGIRSPAPAPPATTNVMQEHLEASAIVGDTPPAEYLWMLTDLRCSPCGGRILRNAAEIYRCADCGVEAEADTVKPDPVGRVTSGACREPYAYRAWLLGTSVFGGSQFASSAAAHHGPKE